MGINLEEIGGFARAWNPSRIGRKWKWRSTVELFTANTWATRLKQGKWQHIHGASHDHSGEESWLTFENTQVALSPVFLVSLVVVLTVLVRLPSVTCAVPVACSPPPRSGASGTSRSTRARSELNLGNCHFKGRKKFANKMIRRFATASALAASAVPSLLLARGHQIMSVPEVPLVIDSAVFEAAAAAKTSAALGLLKAVGAGADIEKVKGSKKLRAGKGKLRGRRHRQRRGPLVIYDPEVDGKELVKGFRNIAGVETASVYSLNLLQLAPGGHLGRFVIWTSAGFKALDKVYGSTTEPSALKKDFLLPSNVVAQADLTRLINSSEIQSVLNAPKGEARTKRAGVQKKNPLKNKQVMLRLNPYASAFQKEKLGEKKVEGGKPQAPSAEFFEIMKE